jgi:DNA repair protein RadD
MYQLRPYQEKAVESFFHAARAESQVKTLIVAPTGAGKSLIIAEITKRAIEKSPKNILILAHRKELIAQNYEKLKALDVDCSIYSAGLKQKQISSITVAGIQSIFRKSHLLPFISLVIIDEAHLLSPEGEGMYRTLLKSLVAKNPQLKLLGLTATPYRMRTGMLTDDNGLFNSICYNIDLKSLISDNYLCNVISKGSIEAIETKNLLIRAKEFALEDAAEKFNLEKLIKVIAEIKRFAYDRKSIIVFCSSVESAETFCELLKKFGERAECVTGESLFRDQILENFKNQKIRILVNVDVLTTGFDAPCADCIVLLRPTMSAGLYTQMIGRVMRTYPGKENALVLDFAENIERHGPIDEITVQPIRSERNKNPSYVLQTARCKICPDCRTGNASRALKCSQCDHIFDPSVNHGEQASAADVISNDKLIYDVQEVFYTAHRKIGKPDSLKIEYKISDKKSVYQYLCLEHGGYAAQRARQAWQLHATPTTPIPDTVEEALFYSAISGLKKVKKVKIKKEGKYYTPIGFQFEQSA